MSRSTVISDCIKRFRENPPTAEGERRSIHIDSFWWLNNGNDNSNNDKDSNNNNNDFVRDSIDWDSLASNDNIDPDYASQSTTIIQERDMVKNDDAVEFRYTSYCNDDIFDSNNISNSSLNNNSEVTPVDTASLIKANESILGYDDDNLDVYASNLLLECDALLLKLSAGSNNRMATGHVGDIDTAKRDHDTSTSSVPVPLVPLEPTEVIQYGKVVSTSVTDIIMSINGNNANLDVAVEEEEEDTGSVIKTEMHLYPTQLSCSDESIIMNQKHKVRESQESFFYLSTSFDNQGSEAGIPIDTAEEDNGCDANSASDEVPSIREVLDLQCSADANSHTADACVVATVCMYDDSRQSKHDSPIVDINADAVCTNDTVDIDEVISLDVKVDAATSPIVGCSLDNGTAISTAVTDGSSCSNSRNSITIDSCHIDPLTGVDMSAYLTDRHVKQLWLQMLLLDT